MSDDIKFGINEQVIAPIVIGPRLVSGETRVRFIIENATINNAIAVRGRIKGQNSWDLLTTFTGNAAQNVNVNVYDELQLEVTAYESQGNFVRILASGFNPAEGSAISTIGVPFGDNIDESPRVNFTSSNSSVMITGSQATGTIDFTVDASSNPNSFATVVPTIGTSPVATTSADTLTMVSTDSTIAIAGNSTAKSLDFTAGTAIKNNLVRQESRTVSPTEFSDKQLTLNAIPAINSKTRFTIVGGPEQKYSVDFIVAGNILTWSSLGLDGLIETGDSLLITYP